MKKKANDQEEKKIGMVHAMADRVCVREQCAYKRQTHQANINCYNQRKAKITNRREKKLKNLYTHWAYGERASMVDDDVTDDNNKRKQKKKNL